MPEPKDFNDRGITARNVGMGEGAKRAWIEG